MRSVMPTHLAEIANLDTVVLATDSERYCFTTYDMRPEPLSLQVIGEPLSDTVHVFVDDAQDHMPCIARLRLTPANARKLRDLLDEALGQ